MNKKYIIFVVILCALVLAFSVFTAFVPQTAQADEIMPLDSDKSIVVTGVSNVPFDLLLSDYDSDYVLILSHEDAIKIGSNIFRFNLPEDMSYNDLYITLLARDSDRVFYINRVLYSYDTGPIQYNPSGVSIWQSTVNISNPTMPVWDTLYFDYVVTWNVDIYNSLQRELDNVSNQLDIANDTIDSLKSGSSALDFVGTAFEKVGDILEIEILPNITIGTIVSVPLILGVVFLILRLVRGE